MEFIVYLVKRRGFACKVSSKSILLDALNLKTKGPVMIVFLPSSTSSSAFSQEGDGSMGVEGLAQTFLHLEQDSTPVSKSSLQIPAELAQVIARNQGTLLDVVKAAGSWLTSEDDGRRGRGTLHLNGQESKTLG